VRLPLLDPQPVAKLNELKITTKVTSKIYTRFKNTVEPIKLQVHSIPN